MAMVDDGCALADSAINFRLSRESLGLKLQLKGWVAE